jgi:hypothetical protein
MLRKRNLHLFDSKAGNGEEWQKALDFPIICGEDGRCQGVQGFKIFPVKILLFSLCT